MEVAGDSLMGAQTSETFPRGGRSLDPGGLPYSGGRPSQKLFIDAGIDWTKEILFLSDTLPEVLVQELGSKDRD